MAGMDPDDRAFMRELLLRHEKSTDAMIERFNVITRRFDENTDRFREHNREMREDHREFVAEMRAQRAALFRILDRLGKGPAGAGA
jgi:hypothetical protein